MIVHHRNNAPRPTEYTMAMDKVEFIALQCAVRLARDMIKESGLPFSLDGSINLELIFAALDTQINHPVEK